MEGLIKITDISNLKEMKIVIRNELEGIVYSFVSLGYHLKTIRDTKMYKEEGHETIYDFAKAEYNMSKSNVSRYMAINDRFSVGGNSRDLAVEFKNFGSSKLSEILTLTDEQIQNISPETTRILNAKPLCKKKKTEKED